MAGVRRHWPLVALLAVAGLLRLATALTYAPALMWTDSWQYLDGIRYSSDFLPDKPNGYPAFLHVMGTGSHLGAVTAIQHVLGLAGGVLLYVLLRRLGCGRTLATLAAAIVLLDGYAIALEQHVLAEALFTFALVLWAVVATTAPRSPAFAALAAVLLVGAIALRSVAVFVVPVWIAYALWAYRERWSRVGAVAVVIVGIIAYATWHDASVGGRGFNQMDGWIIYGRVAEIGDCPGRSVPASDRPLCPPVSDRPEGWPDPYAYSLFSPRSPLQREIGDLYALPAAERLAANDRLGAFARGVIVDRPLAFAGIVLRDTGRYFIPGEMSPLPNLDDPITLPERSRPLAPASVGARRVYAPDYDPPPEGKASALPSYQRLVHAPRWLLGLFLVASGAALVARLVPRTRDRIEHAPEIMLLAGSGLALLVGSAFSHFEPRYLIPAVPLLAAGGVVATRELARFMARPGAKSAWPSRHARPPTR
ncbi:MAG: hypothetical protein QOH58_5 [Thermoleophilaceae bacterium]|nr:hypothetical protein [Thermoleophilaceae bacterium]